MRVRAVRKSLRIHTEPGRRNTHIAIAATGGFDGTYTWGIVLAGVVGVAQASYVLINQAFDGKLSKNRVS